MRYLPVCLFLIALFIVPTGSCQPLSDYLYMTNLEMSLFDDVIWFWGHDILTGDVHSNDYFGMKGVGGQPQFYGGLVTTSQDEFHYASGADPYFELPPLFNIEPLELPENLLPLRALAIQQGHYYPNDTGNLQQGRLQGSEDGWVLHLWNLGVPYDSTNLTLIDTIEYNNGLDWMCVFFEGDLDMFGDSVQGKTVIGNCGNIRLLDNLIVEGADIDSLGAVNFDNENMLYLASEGAVIVADTWVNGRGNGVSYNDGHQRQDIVISAGIFAVGESFTFEHQNDSWNTYYWCDPSGPHPGEHDERGSIYLYGSLVQYRRGYVHRSNCGGTGYSKRYTYDSRWGQNPVPLLEFTNSIDDLTIRLENDTLIVDQQHIFVTGDSVILGPGAYLRFEGDGRYIFRHDAELIVQGTEENPVRIVDATDSDISPIVPLNHHGKISTGTWSHFILETNGTFSLPALALDHGLIHSIPQTTDLTLTYAGEVEINDVCFEGYFEIFSGERHAYLHHSIVEGRLIIRDPMTIDHVTVIQNVPGHQFPGIRTLDDVEILNTVIYGGFSVPVQCSRPQFHTTIAYSCFYGTNSDYMTNVQVGPGVFEANPCFINPGSGDYHLNDNSPLIDAGDPQSPMDDDCTRADIGCYFYRQGDQQLDAEENEDGTLPDGFEVQGPWPNPFNGTMTMQVELPQPELLQLDVYDVLGRRIRTAEQHCTSGTHSLSINLEAEPAGVYFVRINTSSESRVAKALLVR